MKTIKYYTQIENTVNELKVAGISFSYSGASLQEWEDLASAKDYINEMIQKYPGISIKLTKLTSEEVEYEPDFLATATREELVEKIRELEGAEKSKKPGGSGPIAGHDPVAASGTAA